MADCVKVNFGNQALDNKIKEWLALDKNEKTRAAVVDLINNSDVDTLEKLLLTRLAFGTAGLRGVMGPGFAAMNDLVIIQTSQGLAAYLEAVEPSSKEKGVVIGFDGRHNSHRFAQLAALAFLEKGIPVNLYSKITPTPFVPFGVIQLKCSAGIMVTASHNPKEDNGYKVYWSNGSQIIPPHDKGIQKSIENHLEPWPNAWDTSTIANNPLCKDPLEEMKSKYYASLSKLILSKEINKKCSLKFTFTAMHGVSHSYMVEAFNVCGFKHYIPVKEQMDPDPDFPTVKFPNPEEGKSALDLSIQTANSNNSTIILANDPDADRLAVAEKLNNGEWKVFNGNETGTLLGWWMFHCFKEQNPNVPPSDLYMISSTVSSKILQSIAEKEGFNFMETLTGFKWMGNKANELIKNGKHVLFAFEEAIGYMCGTIVLDKDGVAAAMMVAQLAAYLQTKDLTLHQHLQNIFDIYGYHVCNNSYYICHHHPTIVSMFTRLRNFTKTNNYPTSLGSYTIQGVRDLTTGYDNTQPNCKAILPTGSSQMITFYFTNGCVATLRTSGTEPKIKYYTELRVKKDRSEWATIDKELSDIVDMIVKEWMEPEKNNLTPRTE